MTPEELYLQLADLVAEMPDLANGPITPEINKWLGRAAALVEQVGDISETATIRVASQRLDVVRSQRANQAQTIAVVVYQALAKAELNAPARVRGTFIAAGDLVGAYAAVGKLLRTAKTDVLMIDAYADEKLVSDYALLAPDNVVVRILTDAADYKKTLKPAAERWVKQFGHRPLAIRLAPDKTLHDRLIVIDGIVVWSLGQSFNRLAERAHTSLTKMDTETAERKILVYAAMWESAAPLTASPAE